jgi:hypothetical protein
VKKKTIWTDQDIYDVMQAYGSGTKDLETYFAEAGAGENSAKRASEAYLATTREEGGRVEGVTTMNFFLIELEAIREALMPGQLALRVRRLEAELAKPAPPQTEPWSLEDVQTLYQEWEPSRGTLQDFLVMKGVPPNVVASVSDWSDFRYIFNAAGVPRISVKQVKQAKALARAFLVEWLTAPIRGDGGGLATFLKSKGVPWGKAQAAGIAYQKAKTFGASTKAGPHVFWESQVDAIHDALNGPTPKTEPAPVPESKGPALAHEATKNRILLGLARLGCTDVEPEKFESGVVRITFRYGPEKFLGCIAVQKDGSCSGSFPAGFFNLA